MALGSRYPGRHFGKLDARASARKETDAAYYQANKAKVRAKNDAYRRELQALNVQMKIERGACPDCNQHYPPYVMDWHHRDPSEKKGQIYQFVQRSMKKAMLEEIAKCDLLCANCHRIRTHAEDRGIA